MSTIKFPLLQIGQQFEYRGQHYTKVSPLIASNNDDGSRKMIPRSALVTVAQGELPVTDREEKAPHPALAILERYHQMTVTELKSLCDDEVKLGAARARLEAVKDELAKTLQ